MAEVGDGSVDMVVTSPPYWHIKDYRIKGQIGYGQSLHEYLKIHNAEVIEEIRAEMRRLHGEGAK
ncbi:MAG: DNA methyltransferase [Halobacteria archaeon]